jgi:hypothetical protein
MALLDLQGMETGGEDNPAKDKHSRLSVVACHAHSGLSLLNCV